MISAFFRLIVITFSSIAVIGAVLLAIRFYGLNHSYISVEHPLQNTPFFIVAEGGGSEVAPLFSQLAYDYAASLSNDIWLEADLRLSKDRRWVIVGEDVVDSLTSKKGRVSEFTLAELKDLNWGLHYKKNDGTFPYKNHKLDLLSVEEFLDRYPNRKIILDLHAKAPGAA
ncbi:MAG: hypothetical protein KDD61_05675, partial [Bdellovibrionales bacterium]|nr:hypothetical protein [Bdellovibrionales bacterium]